MQSGISFIVPRNAIVLLCLVYTYFLFLSLSVIARCFVSFILVQFFFTSVFMLQFCLKEEEEEEEEGMATLLTFVLLLWSLTQALINFSITKKKKERSPEEYSVLWLCKLS